MTTPDTVSREFTVTFGSGVADVISHARTLIQKAYGEALLQGEDALNEVREMEMSFYSNFVHLISMGASSYDGDLKISRDSEDSFFFIHPKSGYCGGLIFHRKYRNGERHNVGTWSIHT